MLIKAEQKYIRVSPIKLRFVANMIKKSSSPQTAIAYLEHVQKSASVPLIKTLKQAVANATNNHGIMPDTLVIKQLMIGEGPTFKRWMAVSRGMAHPIAKKTAHIRVILENVEKKVERKESTDHGLQFTAKDAEEKSATKKAVVSSRKSVVKK
ncbi:MAG: 50S ribosomal protein L22 [bacterium]|nr:50S ribosomal protein L22 [bacterium]